MWLYVIGGVAGEKAEVVNYGQVMKGLGWYALKIWFGMQISIGS